MPEPTTTTPLAVLPFEDMNRDDMIAHLLDYHGFNALSYNSKVTKNNLVADHNQRHQPGWTIPVAHEHRALAAADFAGAGDLVKTLEKPLTVAERNALKQLVDNDFDSLNKEIETQASVVLAARLEEVTQTYAAKRDEAQAVNDALAAIRDEAQAIVTKTAENARAAVASIKENATSRGITVRGGDVDSYITSRGFLNSWTVDVIGEQEATNQARNEVSREKQSARLAADRQRLAVNRQIMLAAIPEAVRPLVAEIPTAKSLYAAAAENKQIEA